LSSTFRGDCLITYLLLLCPFNSLFSGTTWVSRHQKGKPFWILLKQEMVGWQWHQLDHMQIICSSLQTDNHASTSPLSFLQAGCPSCHPTNSIKALKAGHVADKLKHWCNRHTITVLPFAIYWQHTLCPQKRTWF